VLILAIDLGTMTINEFSYYSAHFLLYQTVGRLLQPMSS
jgi:hypothetical protein